MSSIPQLARWKMRAAGQTRMRRSEDTPSHGSGEKGQGMVPLLIRRAAARPNNDTMSGSGRQVGLPGRGKAEALRNLDSPLLPSLARSTATPATTVQRSH